MNIGIILAGGIGIRMKMEGLPKQFLELYGKPIIIYTLEHFQDCADIDYVIIACVEGWESYLEKKIKFFGLDKVKLIIKGGKTRQESVHNALQALFQTIDNSDIIVIHEAVRPLISSQILSECIGHAKNQGTTLLALQNNETIINDSPSRSIIRDNSYIMKTPQCFKYNTLIQIHQKAARDNIYDFIDEPHMLLHYNEPFSLLKCETLDNIKITRPEDFYIFKALYEMRQSMNILGL